MFFKTKIKCAHFQNEFKCAILGFFQNCCILEKSRENLVKFSKNSAKMQQALQHFVKISKKFSNFNEKIEIRERCKGVHCVDLGESFPTNIYLQNLASIQPRTSPTKTIPDTPIPTPPPPLKPTLSLKKMSGYSGTYLSPKT